MRFICAPSVVGISSRDIFSVHEVMGGWGLTEVSMKFSRRTYSQTSSEKRSMLLDSSSEASDRQRLVQRTKYVMSSALRQTDTAEQITRTREHSWPTSNTRN